MKRYMLNFDTRKLPYGEAEVLVVGAGIAGLYTAWCLCQMGHKVTIAVKETLKDSNTYKAQGGIAAAIGFQDCPSLHVQDTLEAGAGLCFLEGVETLASEGIEHIQSLVELGVPFDRERGKIALAREGCHSRARVLHAGGDATGGKIVDVLLDNLKTMPVTFLENHYVVDVLVNNKVCYGALMWDEKARELRTFYSRKVVLATGGVGQLYKDTTNPQGATGDGIAAAFRAGAQVMDMEFVQFHPTALALPNVPSFLISEAVRGEGGLLRNSKQETFMTRYHPKAELAPRDVVTRAMYAEMAKTPNSQVYLDVTHLETERVRRRFPGIYETCQQYGLDITKQPIPVSPAAHYLMGGVKTDLWGQTKLKGLYCCGEMACTGIHGANRLASNSLLEGLVMGRRIAQRIQGQIDRPCMRKPVFVTDELCGSDKQEQSQVVDDLKRNMQQYAGPLRTGEGLHMALSWFAQHRHYHSQQAMGIQDFKMRNMLTVGELIVRAASLRTESRGGHFRQDYPQSEPQWNKRLVFNREGDKKYEWVGNGVDYQTVSH